jgi:cell division protein FtsI/penicillin-binding protein 2
MAPLNRSVCACALVLLMGVTWTVPEAAQTSTKQSSALYTQAVSSLLDRQFPSTQIDYLLMDAQSQQVIAMRWRDAETPMPPGSLLKPFVALAYARLHMNHETISDPFPGFVCHGKSDGCWRVGGHGSLRLEHALAGSCNAYFLALARELAASPGGFEALQLTAAEYGLPAPPDPLGTNDHTAGMWIGVTPEWRIPPRTMAAAYARLASQAGSPVTARLQAGMKLAALPGGTAWRLQDRGKDTLAKTGTAPCVPRSNRQEDRCRVNGDGLVVVVTGSEGMRAQSGMLWLVRQRGTTGAMAAELAGRMMKQLEDADGRNAGHSLN